jgi:hypothetical protein
MRKITLSVVFLAFTLAASAQQYLTEDSLLRSNNWGWKTVTLAPNQTLMIDEDFQDWPLNHDKANNNVATRGRAAATAYADWQQEITLGDGTKAKIDLFRCAAAPQGLSQNKSEFGPKTDPDDGVFEGKANNYKNGQIPDPELGDPLTPGFLEVGRSSSNGSSPAVHSTVVLPAIAGAQIVQYSYSSLGGSKRGIKLERSVDNGATWEVVRNPSKVGVEYATTEEGTSGTGDQVTNPFRSGYFCSGAGVYIEDVIGDGVDVVSLRFTINDGLDGNGNPVAAQDYRLHDLKVIALTGGVAIPKVAASATQIIGLKGQLEITGAQGDVTVYGVTGQRLAVFSAGNHAQTLNLPAGVYLVSEQGQPARKVIVK